MSDPIAIVGMSCRFPGAPDVDAYWRNILAKVDAVSDPPPEAWDTDVYYDPTFEDTDKTYCKRGGYLDAPIGSAATRARIVSTQGKAWSGAPRPRATRARPASGSSVKRGLPSSR